MIKTVKMNKRKVVKTSFNDNDWSDDSSADFRKKIEIEHDCILRKTKKIKKEIDLAEHKINKFLLIFDSLLNITSETNEKFIEKEEIDGVVDDIIIKIALKIADLIKQNVDSLPLPNILKNVLKFLKELFKNKKTGNQVKEEELKELISSTTESSGIGVGEIGAEETKTPTEKNVLKEENNISALIEK